MTTLHDRLADLAEDAPATPPPPDLWRTGRRRAPRRRAAVAAGVVIAAALVAVGSAAVVTRIQAGPDPAGTGTKTVLPDRFFQPSPRLPVAHDPPGLLVAVLPGQHTSWTGSDTEGLVGISATTQRYAFLDLPGWRSGAWAENTWSLSPDGRYVAYWYADHDRPGETGPGPADGIAVFSTVTGKVEKHNFDSNAGVEPTRFGWTADGLLTMRVDYVQDSETGAYARTVGAVAWALPSGTVREVDDPRQLTRWILGPAGQDGFLSQRGRRWYAVEDEADLSGAPVAVARSSGINTMGTISPDYTWLAVSDLLDQDPSRGGAGSNGIGELLVGRVQRGATEVAALDLSAGSDPPNYSEVQGWRDEDTLVLETFSKDGHQLVAVHLPDQEVQPLATFEQSSETGIVYATGLLGSPVADAVEPPHPWPPAAVAAMTGGGTLLLLLGLRRVRRRGAGR
jgi:hypothetical protein